MEQSKKHVILKNVVLSNGAVICVALAFNENRQLHKFQFLKGPICHPGVSRLW